MCQVVIWYFGVESFLCKTTVRRKKNMLSLKVKEVVNTTSQPKKTVDLHGRQNSSKYEEKTGFALLWPYLLEMKCCNYAIFTHQAKTVMAAFGFYLLHQENVMFKSRIFALKKKTDLHG